MAEIESLGLSAAGRRRLTARSSKRMRQAAAYLKNSGPSPSECASPSKCSKSGYNSRRSNQTDPDARMSYKRGKPMSLNHLGIISVDAESHIICGATVDYADKKDSQTVENIVGQTIDNLSCNGIAVEEVLADTNYSSGEAYRYLESKGIESHIPACGSCKSHRDGFGPAAAR